MNDVRWPERFHLEQLQRKHPRRSFHSGEAEVDDWLATKALQNQEKHLSVTRVLLDDSEEIVGYYTIATGQVDFQDLPREITQGLPKRLLPVAVVAWLGVAASYHGQGFGSHLFARALRDCYEAGRTFAFVAVILDCLNESAKSFYRHWDFAELPGNSKRMFLSAKRLEQILLSP